MPLRARGTGVACPSASGGGTKVKRNGERKRSSVIIGSERARAAWDRNQPEKTDARFAVKGKVQNASRKRRETRAKDARPKTAD